MSPCSSVPSCSCCWWPWRWRPWRRPRRRSRPTSSSATSASTSGETLPELRLHYHTVGTPQRDASGKVRNAVLMLHGTGGTGAQFSGANFAGELFGPGQPLDAAKYFVVMPDNIGHGKSSKPSDGLRAKFPRYGYEDMIRAQHLLDDRGARRLAPAARDGHVDGRHAHVAVGAALSGRDGCAHAAREPARPDLGPQPGVAARRDRRHPHRPELEGRQLHDAAARAAHGGADAVAGEQQPGHPADSRRRRWPTPTACSTSTWPPT